MIGLIVTGHGKFASGMKSTVAFIAGEQENVEFINFESNSVEDLAAEYRKVMTETFREMDGILVLCDLVGGSPFRTSTEVSVTCDKPVNIIGGANLAMILETSMSKDILDSLDDLTKLALQAGQEGIVQYTFAEHQENEEEDGI